jgi:hypothetical protein
VLKLTTIILVATIAVSGCANKQAKEQAQRDAAAKRDAAAEAYADSRAQAAINYAMTACNTSPDEERRNHEKNAACLYERIQQYFNNFRSDRRRSTTCINSGAIITCTED